MPRFLCKLALLAGLLPAAAAAEPGDAADAEIRATLAQWTANFNAGNAGEVCALFARDLRYDYRGFPERGYDDICALLQRSLADKSRRYAYALRIRDILVSGDLAAVRLVWTLTVTRAQSAGEMVTAEPGLDIFRKQPDGSWKIIRYIAYEE